MTTSLKQTDSEKLNRPSVINQSSPHIKPPLTVGNIMLGVIWALIPGIIVMFWLYGWGILINITLSIFFAILFESLSLYLRKRPIKVYLRDYSAILTGILLALALPTLVPWWIVLLGVFFAIVLSKHLYGGLGYNVFNPAMVAYAILIISFPEEMTTLWQNSIVNPSNDLIRLDFLSTLQFQLLGQLPANLTLDAFTSATPLNNLKIALSNEVASISELQAVPQNIIYGYFSGQATEWVNVSFLIAGLWMIYKKYISWQIPTGFLFALFLSSLCLGYGLDTDIHPSPLFHLFSGATMLGAFFIATDPVSASTTPKGRLIFGFGIGCLVYIIRTWGGYPDAIAFAVILMNITVPLIDYYTQPRVYGYDK